MTQLIDSITATLITTVNSPHCLQLNVCNYFLNCLINSCKKQKQKKNLYASLIAKQKKERKKEKNIFSMINFYE